MFTTLIVFACVCMCVWGWIECRIRVHSIWLSGLYTHIEKGSLIDSGSKPQTATAVWIASGLSRCPRRTFDESQNRRFALPVRQTDPT